MDEIKNNCTKCKYFISWFDYMNDGDDLEPVDEGKCDHDDSEDVSAGVDHTCDLFKKIT